MGEIVDAMINGELCAMCGDYVGEGDGFPELCPSCEAAQRPWPKKPKKEAYVVWVGRVPGVYATWDECNAQVNGFPGAKYRGFFSASEASRAFAEGAPTVHPAAQRVARPATVHRPPISPRHGDVLTKHARAVVATGAASIVYPCIAPKACEFPLCNCYADVLSKPKTAENE